MARDVVSVALQEEGTLGKRTAKVLPQEHAAKNKALRQQSAGLPGEEQEDP